MKKKIRFLAMLMAVVFAMTAAPGSTVEAASLKKPAKVKISSVKATSSSAITVKWKKASKAKGYQVYVAKDKKFKKGKKTATTTAKSKSISGLSANTTYYVKVRAYNKKGSKKKYGSWSAVKKVKTAKAAAKKTTNQTTTSKPAASNPTPSTPSKPAHQHVWEEVVEERVVDSYAITPFSEGVNPASHMNKYRCMCKECEATGKIFGGYGEEADLFKEHMEEAKSPGWYEEVWEHHTLCRVCGKDLSLITDGIELANHMLECGSNGVGTDVVVARIEHPSHTAGERADIIVGYKCSCGATKAAN